MYNESNKVPIDETEFEEIGKKIGELVAIKNKAYGDSFSKSGEILKQLFPNGVQPDQYQDLLTIVRIIDKLFRIATKKDALGENPWKDICGYSILAIKSSAAKADK